MADSKEAKLANDPTDNAEAADPMLPMLRIEPTEPIDSSELVEAIESIEFREAMLQREVSCSEVVMQSCSQSDAGDEDLMDEARTSLFDEYDTTIVSTLHPEHGWTDPALVAIERGQPAIVMTAWNPGHHRATDDENREANELMLRELLATGHEVWRADGRAPDGSHPEEGWIAWGLPVAYGLAVAARFGQFAVYAYDETGARVTVACPDSVGT